MDKYKILFIIDTLGAGGAQRQLVHLVKNIDRHKFAVTLCNLGYEDDFFIGELKRCGISVVTISQHGKLDISCLWKLINLISEERPRIVQTALFTSDSYGRMAAIFSGVPIIISSQRSLDLWKGGRHILLDRVLSKFTTAFIVNAKAVKQFLLKKRLAEIGKISVVHNGVELVSPVVEAGVSKLKRDLKISAPDRVIGMIARFDPQKDHKTFLKMAGEIFDKNKDARFLLAGDGPLRKNIEDMAMTSRIRDRINFLDPVEDVSTLFSVMNISVLTSSCEGCSNVILEAMSAGKPVVATNVGGNAELIKDKDSGFLVDPGRPGDLAEKVLYLLENPGIAETMGRIGRKTVVENFSIDRMVGRTVNLYRELIEGIKEN